MIVGCPQIACVERSSAVGIKAVSARADPSVRAALNSTRRNSTARPTRKCPSWLTTRPGLDQRINLKNRPGRWQDICHLCGHDSFQDRRHGHSRGACRRNCNGGRPRPRTCARERRRGGSSGSSRWSPFGAACSRWVARRQSRARPLLSAVLHVPAAAEPWLRPVARLPGCVHLILRLLQSVLRVSVRVSVSDASVSTVSVAGVSPGSVSSPRVSTVGLPTVGLPTVGLPTVGLPTAGELPPITVSALVLSAGIGCGAARPANRRHELRNHAG